MKEQRLEYCINSEIGTTMKRLRMINGYSQEYVAQYTKLSKSYLSEIENGKKNIDIRIIKDYAKVFAITLSDFFLMHDYLAYEAKENLVKLLVHDRKKGY